MKLYNDNFNNYAFCNHDSKCVYLLLIAYDMHVFTIINQNKEVILTNTFYNINDIKSLINDKFPIFNNDLTYLFGV